jgi:hypothetical protein
MWVFLNNAFLSIVENRDNSDELLVRARVKGDIERVFDDITVTETPKADYRYRAYVARDQVIEAMVRQVKEIDYANFKGSIPYDDGMRAMAYADVWSVMRDLQKASHIRGAARQPPARSRDDRSRVEIGSEADHRSSVTRKSPNET